ncbi:MAG TPA: YIP1 family protein [Verrucomicrobiae bacterium]|nr:YIP1 family protein [Verrucomicrobiae bacterium]
METLPPVLENAPQEPPRTMSLASRLFNIFATPGEVFEQIKNTPVSTANWLTPALTLIVVTWLGVSLIFSQDSIQQQLKEITDQAVEKQVQKGKLTEQQAEQARAVAAKFGSLGSKIGAYSTPVLVGLVLPFWWGLLVWLIGTQALHADFSYMKGVEMVGLGGMVGVLDAIVRSLLILIMGNLFASPSLALFLKQFDPQNPTHSLLAVVNIMTFWSLAVRSIGLARLSSTRFGKAAAWVFGIWIIQTSVLVGLSLAAQKIAAR